MKAIVVSQYGDLNVLELKDVPTPKPKQGQALVRIKAAGLNFIDIYMRKGAMGRMVPLPFIPGLEASGIVEAVGEGVTEVKPGDRVAYTKDIGSYAEYNVVKAAHLIPLPDDMSFEAGAAFPLQGITAHYLLHDYYHIKAGDWVLMHAAAGGVGLLVVQWLKKIGARIIGTVSSEKKAELAREAGAHEIINYKDEDFVAKVRSITDGRGVDYIIDGVGKSTFNGDLEAVRTRGWITIFGMASGPADPIVPNELQTKSITLSGGMLMNYITTREDLLSRANDVIGGLREGWLTLTMDYIFPLAEVRTAQRMLERRETVGKVLLINSD